MAIIFIRAKLFVDRGAADPQPHRAAVVLRDICVSVSVAQDATNHLYIHKPESRTHREAGGRVHESPPRQYSIQEDQQPTSDFRDRLRYEKNGCLDCAFLRWTQSLKLAIIAYSSSTLVSC